MSQDFDRQEEKGSEFQASRPLREGGHGRVTPPGDEVHDEGSLDPVIRKALAGGRSSQDELFRVLRPSVLLFVRTQMSSALRMACEDDDVCQDVLYDVCRSLSQSSHDYQGETSFRQWLRTITLNRIRDLVDHQIAAKRNRSRAVSIEAMSSRTRDRFVVDPNPSQDAAAQIREEIDHLMQAIDRLDPAEAELIRLVDFEQISVNRAAKMLGTSEPSARRQRNRALAKIALFLGSTSEQ